jgi:hypothetical protein
MGVDAAQDGVWGDTALFLHILSFLCVTKSRGVDYMGRAKR